MPLDAGVRMKGSPLQRNLLGTQPALRNACPRPCRQLGYAVAHSLLEQPFQPPAPLLPSVKHKLTAGTKRGQVGVQKSQDSSTDLWTNVRPPQSNVLWLLLALTGWPHNYFLQRA